ncbi:MAG: hypothetical protein RLZZ600_1231 [Actinomycetota bacterium]
MPLSEEEQRLLDEMERNLYGSSQDVHSTNGSTGRISSRGILFGFVGVLAGLTLLVLGVTTQVILLGVGGFVLMFAGIVAAVSLKAAPRAGSASASSSSARAPRSSRPGFMSRLENRWDERG